MTKRRARFHRFKAKHFKDSTIIISPEAIAAREDLNKFIEFVMGLPVGCDYHQLWSDRWVTGNSNSLLNKIAGPDLSILAPRSAAKSTRLAAFIAWAIGHNPGIPIIYLSYKENIALSRSRIIKRIIDTKEYRQVFPDIRPNKAKWNDTEWEIDKAYAGVKDLTHDYTLYAAGLSGAIASKRSWLIAIDDPIKNTASIANPDVRAKIRDNWRTAVLPTLVPGGRILGIGTRFLKDDIHTSDLCPAKGIEQLELPAIIANDDGTERSYWPTMAPLDTIQKLNLDGSVDSIKGLRQKREEDPLVFSFQMQNKIVASEDVQIDPLWIQWTYEIPPWSSFDTFAIGMDLAARQRERYDFTALTLFGRSNGRLYVLNGVRGRWVGNLDKIEQILELAWDWQLVGKAEDPETGRNVYFEKEGIRLDVFCEDQNYQASLHGDWESIVKGDYKIYSIRCLGAKAKGDKATRLRATTGYFQKGLIYFNEHNRRRLEPLVQEIVDFGLTSHDDYVDSFAYGVSGIRERAPLT